MGQKWRNKSCISTTSNSSASSERTRRSGKSAATARTSPCCSVANRLGESIADTIHKGDHVLVDGQLVSSKYERENGESKKRKSAKFAIFWSVRANSIRRLSRSEAEIPAAAASSESGAESGDTPF